MEALAMKALFGILGLLGGAAALENLLENYIMAKVPAWAKPMVAPLVSFVFAVVLAVQGGASWDVALGAGFALWGGATTLHNMPSTTSADWGMPPAPDKADGLPVETR